MSKLKLSSINVKNLKNDKLTKKLPEFYELKKIIENNEWHIKDYVFNHTINVLINLEKLFKKYANLNKYLNRKIGHHSRKQLLFLSTLLHDIAKKDTIIKKRGITSCPAHDIKGGIKAKRILKRFDLSASEINFVAKIVRKHALLYNMLRMTHKSRDLQIARHKDILVELSLLSIADMLGSQLKIKNPEKFKKGMYFYKDILNLCLE